MTGEVIFLAFFFLLELVIEAPLCGFIYGNERQA
jgi:hypothetical protein